MRTIAILVCETDTFTLCWSTGSIGTLRLSSDGRALSCYNKRGVPVTGCAALSTGSEQFSWTR